MKTAQDTAAAVAAFGLLQWLESATLVGRAAKMKGLILGSKDVSQGARSLIFRHPELFVPQAHLRGK